MTVSHHRGTQAKAQFRHLFGSQLRPLLAQAPGRVNLIGEHTDYNDGWVLPMAIDRHIWIAFATRREPRIRAHSIVFNETIDVALDDLQSFRGSRWISYLAGVAWAMEESGHAPTGMDLVVDGDLPIGSGLSSSAALEMAMARALCAVSGAPWVPAAMARLGQRVETEFIGVKGGLMDQLVSAAALPGCALLLDCRSLEFETVPIPVQMRVVVLDTGCPRALAGSAYNDRRASCDRAVDLLRQLEPSIRALRDVGPDLLQRARGRMEDTTFRRASHVVHETLRPRALADALAREDFRAAGRLMNDSHTSLRDLYAVSSPELDLITDLARQHPGCYGARLTGAGFGGCALALVTAEAVEDFMRSVHSEYEAQSGKDGDLFAVEAVGGARLLAEIDPEE